MGHEGQVAAALGHTSFRVTDRHYAQPAAIASARQQAAAETVQAPNPSKTLGQESVNADAKYAGKEKAPVSRGLGCEEGDSNPHGC